MSVIRVSLAVFVLSSALCFGAPSAAGAQALEDEPATAPLAGAAELTEAERRSSQSGQRADEAARSEASVRFRTGVNLYLEGDFQGAMAEFQRAYASMPSALVLYNLAQTHLALRDYVAARDTLLPLTGASRSKRSSRRCHGASGPCASLATKTARK
jgi:tetratricopeptide (TPR) repeat protein